MDELQGVLDRLFQACVDFDLPTIIAILHELPLEYMPQSDAIADVIWLKSNALDMNTLTEATRTGT